MKELPSKYHREINGVVVDVYDILHAYEVPNHAVGHAIKKLLMPGERHASKDKVQDLQEAIDSIRRAISDIGGENAEPVYFVMSNDMVLEVGKMYKVDGHTLYFLGVQEGLDLLAFADHMNKSEHRFFMTINEHEAAGAVCKLGEEPIIENAR